MLQAIPPEEWRKQKSEIDNSLLPLAKRVKSSTSESTHHHLVERARSVSRPELVELTFKYTISDLSLLPQRTRQVVFSPLFCAKSHENIKWQLQVYPNGDSEVSKGHLGLFLLNKSVKDNLIPPVSAGFKFVILKSGQEIETGINSYRVEFTSNFSSWGSKKFLSLDQLKNVDINQENELTIVCSIVFEAKRVCLMEPSR